MFDEIPMPLDWPVYVSHAEANAYAHWAGNDLPSEAEWQRAAQGTPEGIGNFDFRHWNPVPVSHGAVSKCGVVGQFGNGWEWTRTPFEPFPGFQPFPFYAGYSANFF